jgi:LacI family transcriptional regulator
MSSRPTIKEVSRIAGVSFKTVSRVLNNEKHVSDATRRRVEEAVAQLNFRPSHAARTLAGRKSFQVALLYDNPSPYYVYHVQAGAQKACVRHGYRLLHQPCDLKSPDFVASVMALVDEAHLDGLIISPPVTDRLDLLDVLDARGIPYTRIAPGERREAGKSASMDDFAAASELTDYLLGEGHARIAFIQGPQNHVSSSDRFAGYRAALEKAGVKFDPALVVAGTYTFTSGLEAANTLFALPEPPTAIFAGNDEMAAGALAAAHEAKIDVPGQLSIAGFDDTDLARAVWPMLTTVHQPVAELAMTAADLLLGEQKERHKMLKHELKTRDSSGPAPKR